MALDLDLSEPARLLLLVSLLAKDQLISHNGERGRSQLLSVKFLLGRVFRAEVLLFEQLYYCRLRAIAACLTPVCFARGGDDAFVFNNSDGLNLGDETRCATTLAVVLRPLAVCTLCGSPSY